MYANSIFAIDLPKGWEDRSVYNFYGPDVDGVQHTIMVTAEDGKNYETLQQLADRQVTAMEQSMPACEVLSRQDVALADGRTAHRAEYRWCPGPDRKLFVQQFYVLNGANAYTLTSSFSKKTRLTVGPEIERILMSFALQ